MNVAEVVLQIDAGRWDAPSVQLTGDFKKRHTGALQSGELALEAIQRRDVRARCLPREDPFFKQLNLLGQRIDHREVAVDNGVHERIQHVRGTMPQELRLFFRTAAYIDEALPRAAAH